MASERTRIPANLNYGVIPIIEYTVASWTPLPDGKGKAEMVIVELRVPALTTPLMLRLKSRRAAKEMIDALTFHMNDVWPEVQSGDGGE